MIYCLHLISRMLCTKVIKRKKNKSDLQRKTEMLYYAYLSMIKKFAK